MKSSICSQQQLCSEEFQEWAQRLRLHNTRTHRKVWELCFICAALADHGKLEPGMRGLGFGVGREPLPDFFRKIGVGVLATDQNPDAAERQGWPVGLRPPDRWVDMNAIPEDLRSGGFDFVWSACSMEHLGTLELGSSFVVRAMECLKPGGVAVHTTEYNVGSNDGTLERGGTVLYRRRDIERLAGHLRDRGYQIEVDFTLGTLPNDQVVDVPPYAGEHGGVHLRLLIAPYTVTSIGLVIRKRQ